MWHVWGRREIFRVLLRNSEGSSPLERPTYRWKDKVNMKIKGICWKDVDRYNQV
jgi:hypothetical protein